MTTPTDDTTESTESTGGRGNSPGRVLLDEITAGPVPAPVVGDIQAKEEAQFFDRAAKEADADLARARAKGALQDVEERKLYAARIFWLMLGWLVALFLVLFLAGWKPLGFALDRAVLLALIGGTTANVLGIFVLVARYLFWRQRDRD